MTDPCDGTCGCESVSQVPIACSLPAGVVAERVEEWRAVLAAVVQRTTLPAGVRLEFERSAPLGEIARLVAAEHECCPFFGFVLTVDGRGTVLEVTAPADGQELVAAVFGAPS